ncbi:MAG TPA: hypothetical protein VIF15_14555 [Polyangiaceae bacterium]|jgi:hypothetical protein
MSWLRVSRRDAIRSGVAGAQGVASRGAAQALFHAGGRRVLPELVQRAVRGAVEREASRLMAGFGLLERGAASAAASTTASTAASTAASTTASTAASTAASAVPGTAMRAVAAQGARAAGREILRGVTVAAGAGALIDGGWALVQAVRGVRRGTMSRKQAAVHVAREATTGAAATAAGTAAAALLVVVTGGVAAPAVFFVGAAATLSAKAGLDAWLAMRARGAIRAELDPAPT